MRIEQVLLNLVSNAIKFTEKGEVAVKVEKVKLEEKKVTLKFSVKDTGIGLTEEEMKRLFHKFEQADTSITRTFGGKGLGLAISKKLIEMMNGNIWVESKKDVGSIFPFVLELDIWKEKDRKRPSSQMLHGLKVLIVTHEKITLYDAESLECLDKLKEMLKGQDYDMDLRELENYIGSYDFDRALGVLEKFTQKLGVNI